VWRAGERDRANEELDSAASTFGAADVERMRLVDMARAMLASIG
jgi:hypothetical protein